MPPCTPCPTFPFVDWLAWPFIRLLDRLRLVFRTQPLAPDGLIGQSHEYRLQWAYRLLERDVRVMDSTLIGNLMTSVSFYANTTIYIIAGLIAALGAADKLVTVAADLPFGRLGSQHLLEMKLILLLGSFVFAYFKFTWSLRQFNMLSILVSAAPPGRPLTTPPSPPTRSAPGRTNSLAGTISTGHPGLFQPGGHRLALLNPAPGGLQPGRPGRPLPPGLLLAPLQKTLRLDAP